MAYRARIAGVTVETETAEEVVALVRQELGYRVPPPPPAPNTRVGHGSIHFHLITRKDGTTRLQGPFCSRCSKRLDDACRCETTLPSAERLKFRRRRAAR